MRNRGRCQIFIEKQNGRYELAKVDQLLNLVHLNISLQMKKKMQACSI